MRRILPVACVAFAFTVGLSAQTGTGSSPQTSTPQESSTQKAHGSTAKSGGRAVILTGCLREGDTPGTFQLTNVDMSGMSEKSGKGTQAHSSTATSGGSTSGTETSSQSSMGSSGTVNLVAGGSVDLKEHVGHRVQVSGSWANASSGTSGTSGYGAGAGQASGQASSAGQTGSEGSKSSMSGNDMNGRQLTVKSLKHISDTCQ